MVFDDDQKNEDVGGSAQEDAKRDDRRQRGAGAAAAAGAGGAGLGAGAAAGIVGGDEAVDAIRDIAGESAADVDVDAVQSRIEAAQEAAREATRTASMDVFESQAADAADAVPAGIADAASIIGDALPPLPATEGADAPAESETPVAPPAERPQPEDLIPTDEDGPTPVGRPPIGRPRQEPADDPEAEAPAAPGAPAPPDEAPGAPAPPSFPSPPAGGPPPVESGSDDDAVVSEAPAPPAGPAPAPAAGDAGDVAAESPAVSDAPAPPAPGASEDDVAPPVSSEPASPGASDDSSSGPSVPDAPGTSEESAPGAPEAPSTPSDSGPGSSTGESEPPVSSEPGSPAPDAPAAPPSSGGGDAPTAPPSSSGTDAPSAPTTPGGSDSSSPGSSEPAPPPPGGPDTGPPATPPSGPGAGPSPGGEPGASLDYPYVYAWDDDGHWVDMALQNDHGGVYYLRYYDDGSVYYLNEHDQWAQVHGDNLPHLLYVGDDGTAYFSKIQHHDTVYFSYDTYGNFEWADQDDIPGYELEGIEYEYPRLVEYEYGEDAWALIEMEDGRLVKYYDEGGAYWVDEDGNEEAIYGFQTPSLIYVDPENEYAYFRVFVESEGEYRFYFIDEDGGVEYVYEHDVPGYYEDAEPPYEGHAPYFFDVFPNPFHEDVEPDGEPIFANAVYQQSYNDGQIVVTWFQEGGPYQIRYYSEENAGGYLQLHLTYDADDYEYDVNVYPYDYFDHVEEDFELDPIDHYVDFAYLGIPYDNMEISDDYVEYYWYDDDGDPLQKTTVNRHTGEVVYEYDELYIHVDRYGNEYYEGYPNPDWEPPAGYGEVEDYPPYGMPPYLVFGEGYDYEMQYADPDAGGWELISATPADDPDQWQYIGPNGERVIVSKLDEYTYQFAYQTDPNATPGAWEMVMNVTTDQYGNYISYEAVDGEYYDQYYEPEEDYGGVIPEGAPAYFGSEEWVNPELDERFTLDYTETDANGAQHYVYVADLDGDGDVDYKIDVVQYPDGRVEIEYHSETYGHEATFDIITQPNGYYGTYDVTYYVNDPQGVPEYEPVEELYDPAWAEHYASNFDYEHPYDLYGQPDEPGENQAPNVYLFGGGRAMVVRNADGSETITWYSEGGYQDGYVEYQATVAYEGGQWVTESTALPIDLIPVYGIWPVEGEQVYDPYHPDAPWGEPDSVTILDDRVIATWETDQGQIRSEWYRDGSHFREVRYPDGLVISWGGDTWETEVPEGWTGPEDEPEWDAQAVYDLIPDYLPEQFEGGFPNPEHAGEYAYHHTAMYGDAEVHFFSYGDQTITFQENPNGTLSFYWYDRPVDQFGTLGLEDLNASAFVWTNGQIDMRYYEDGEQVAAPIVDQEPPEEDVGEQPDGLMPDGTPEYFGDQMWVNPETDERFNEVQYNPDVDGTGTAYRAYRADIDDDGGAEYLINVWEYPDGSVKIEYYYMNEMQATVDVITQPDGSYGTYSTTYIVSDYVGVPATGEYDEPEVEELDPWTAHLPPYWNMEIGTGQHTNFQNPEAQGQVVEYELVSNTATERVYVDQFGQYVKITNLGGGNFTFSWGDDLDNPDLVMGVPSQGNPTVEYTSIGVVDPWAEQEEEVDELVIEADGYLPAGAPIFFDSGLWPNPEQDNRFEYQYASEPEPGVIVRHYHADLDGNGSYDYRAVVMEYPDGTVHVDYGYLNGQGEARFTLIQDADGNYVEHDAIYYVNNPQGAPFESIAAEDADEEDQAQPSAEEADSDDSGDETAPDDDGAGDSEDDAPELPGDPDEGPPAPPEEPEPPAPPSGSGEEDETQEQLQFLTEEEPQLADEEGVAPLEFNGPETGGDAGEDDQESSEELEEVEPVEIAQPELVEADEEMEPIATEVSDEDDLAADDLDDEDDDDAGL